jgi:hypothetical protein
MRNLREWFVNYCRGETCLARGPGAIYRAPTQTITPANLVERLPSGQPL